MKFKESPLVKNHKILTGTKRDMRKKVVKSTTPTSDLKKPTTLKRQLGGNIFTTYNSIAPYEGPVFEQPVATVEIEELPVNRLEANRRNVITKAEEKKEEPVVEEKVSTKPLPTSKEETPVVENKESTPVNIKSKDEFIKTMTPAFENALKAKGLDTKYAKYLVAQSALESNWGKSQSGKFNFGGIKGKGTIRKTREVINGKSIHINDSFRDFKDINDYANYHVSLLNNKGYQAFSGGDFIDRVVKGGYATDPNYKRALSNVYNQIAKAQEGMKIPKLKGAGELRNRILRQFNREKAANRNEEQLIGFDWSRYKSNKPKPETTPTQSEQLENGGVIKAQDGIVTQAINKVKSILPKEEPKEPINVVDVAKEYAPSAATSFLSGSVNPFINKLLEGKKPSLDYSHKFGSTGNKFEEFASVMTPIFKEALEENGLPTTNLNNLVRQAALESNYGLDPRGERGFNLSGIKHPGDSIAPKYKKSRYKDGFDYIDFDNLKDYANYKVKVLNDRYKALDAKDTNDFIDRLHGNNSGKYNYSADKDSYRRNLNGTLSLNKYLKIGGIIKYQNPSSGIKYIGGYDKKGNMVLPVTNENGMNNVTLPEVTVTPRNINLAGAVDRGKRKFLKTTGELATPVLAGAGIAGLGYGLATATIPTLISLGTSYVGTKVGESIDDKTDNNTNYKTMGGLIGGAVGGLGANMTPRLIAGDAYTTVGGKFGYYGNPLQRFTGTVGRRLNLNTKARNPELLRKISEPAPINSNGTIQVSNPTPRADFARTNFTTDRPVVSHSEKNNWDHMDLMIFDPKITKGLKPASVEPSDTFYPFANITAKPSQTTLVSGNKSALINAQDKGMSTLSSPKLRQIYKDMQAEYLGNLTRYSRMTPLQRRLAKTGFKDNVSPASKKAYAEEIQKLQSKRGTPTIKDYRKIEEDTGLDAGVVDIKDLNPELVDKIANSKGYFTYPNGEVTSSYHYPQAYSDKAVLNRMPYNKVFYDPASPVEEQWAIKNGFLK